MKNFRHLRIVVFDDPEKIWEAFLELEGGDPGLDILLAQGILFENSWCKGTSYAILRRFDGNSWEIIDQENLTVEQEASLYGYEG